MIFQPDEYRSGPNSSGKVPFRGLGESPGGYDRLVGKCELLGDAPLPILSRLTNQDISVKPPSITAYPDALTHPRTLRAVISGVPHRGEAVLTDLANEFPKVAFSPDPRHIAFRAALLDAALPGGDRGDAPHALIRKERIHRALGVALSNLVAQATDKPLHELSLDNGDPTPVPAQRMMNEYLASAWAVRSFIRIATAEPDMFRILVTEMATIEARAKRFSLGVPMSPVMVYELFNAAARNPELTPDVVRAFQIIGYRGSVGVSLFNEFTATLEKQVAAAS